MLLLPGQYGRCTPTSGGPLQDKTTPRSVTFLVCGRAQPGHSTDGQTHGNELSAHINGNDNIPSQRKGHKYVRFDYESGSGTSMEFNNSRRQVQEASALPPVSLSDGDLDPAPRGHSDSKLTLNPGTVICVDTGGDNNQAKTDALLESVDKTDPGPAFGFTTGREKPPRPLYHMLNPETVIIGNLGSTTMCCDAHLAPANKTDSGNNSHPAAEAQTPSPGCESSDRLTQATKPSPGSEAPHHLRQASVYFPVFDQQAIDEHSSCIDLFWPTPTEVAAAKFPDFCRLYNTIKSYKCPNAIGARITLKSGLNLPFWESSLVGYHDNDICAFLRFGTCWVSQPPIGKHIYLTCYRLYQDRNRVGGDAGPLPAGPVSPMDSKIANHDPSQKELRKVADHY